MRRYLTANTHTLFSVHTELNGFKELTAKLTASACDAETCIDVNQTRAEEIRQQISDGDKDRESQVNEMLAEREKTLQGLEEKLEELELKETEQALAQLKG
jgi:hypothetical protein